MMYCNSLAQGLMYLFVQDMVQVRLTHQHQELLLPVKVIHPLLDDTEHPSLIFGCLHPKEAADFPIELRHADSGEADIGRLVLVGVQPVHETAPSIGPRMQKQ